MSSTERSRLNLPNSENTGGFRCTDGGSAVEEEELRPERKREREREERVWGNERFI